MNKVILMGRLTRDPEVRYSSGDNSTAVARFTLAVDRRFRKEGEAQADFINCVSFGKTAEFAEKYYRQGVKICITGRIQTGSYTNRDGQKIYTTDVVVEEQEFAESKANSGGGNAGGQNSQSGQNNNQKQNQNGNQNQQNRNNSGGNNNGYGNNGGYANHNGYTNNNSYNNGYNNYPSENGFMNIPNVIDEELPFN